MTLLRFIAFAILICTSFGGFSQQSCHYIDDNGYEYDLSSLKKPDMWKVKDAATDSGLFSMIYMFNICGNTSMKCKNRYVGALEALEVLGQTTDTCEILGKYENQFLEPVDVEDPHKGIKIKYNKGDTCTNSENSSENNSPRKANFIINCATTQDGNFAQTKINSRTVTKCNLEFTINSPAGCPINSSKGGSFSILMWITIIFLGYLAVGYFMNQKFNGYKGKDALPHAEFWSSVPNLAIEGLNFFVLMMKQFVDNVKQRLNKGGSSSSYSFV